MQPLPHATLWSLSLLFIFLCFFVRVGWCPQHNFILILTVHHIQTLDLYAMSRLLYWQHFLFRDPAIGGSPRAFVEILAISSLETLNEPLSGLLWDHGVAPFPQVFGGSKKSTDAVLTHTGGMFLLGRAYLDLLSNLWYTPRTMYSSSCVRLGIWRRGSSGLIWEETRERFHLDKIDANTASRMRVNL